MLKKKLVVATAVLGTGSLLAAAPALASQSGQSGASWQIIKSFGSGSAVDVRAIATVPGGRQWAFVNTSREEAFAGGGSSWTRMPFPSLPGEGVTAAGATSQANVWAFTAREHRASRALRWNGSSWSVKGTFPGFIAAASVLGPNDVWVFGENLTMSGGGLGVWHYTGHGWSSPGSGAIEGGYARTDADVWGFDQSGVDHWNGRAWNRASLKPLLPSGAQVSGILALSARNVYAEATNSSGALAVLHYDGHEWTRVATSSHGSGPGPQEQIVPDGHGGLWLVGGLGGFTQNAMLHYSGGRVTVFSLPARYGQMSVDALATVPGTGLVLAGGEAFANPSLTGTGVMLQYAG